MAKPGSELGSLVPECVRGSDRERFEGPRAMQAVPPCELIVLSLGRQTAVEMSPTWWALGKGWAVDWSPQFSVSFEVGRAGLIIFHFRGGGVQTQRTSGPEARVTVVMGTQKTMLPRSLWVSGRGLGELSALLSSQQSSPSACSNQRQTMFLFSESSCDSAFPAVIPGPE